MIVRPYYLDMLKTYRDVPLVKILAGIRRCGKSTILDMLKDDLLGSGIAADHVIHLRYTSEELDDSMTAKQMYRDIKEKMTDGERYYLLLDEVQEVDGWEKAVNSLLEDFNTDSPEWFGRFREIAAEEGVYELNRLTAAVNTADMDLKKLWSVAEYAEAEDAEQLTRLARNIGCFTFIEGATGYAEVGRFFTETEDRYILDLEMEDYFDYEGFGEYISYKFYGKFVDGGFIYNDTDTSLLDILYQDEPMTMGGM